jgi:hypothetical protein
MSYHGFHKSKTQYLFSTCHFGAKHVQNSMCFESYQEFLYHRFVRSLSTKNANKYYAIIYAFKHAT